MVLHCSYILRNVEQSRTPRLSRTQRFGECIAQREPDRYWQTFQTEHCDEYKMTLSVHLRSKHLFEIITSSAWHENFFELSIGCQQSRSDVY